MWNFVKKWKKLKMMDFAQIKNGRHLKNDQNCVKDSRLTTCSMCLIFFWWLFRAYSVIWHSQYLQILFCHPQAPATQFWRFFAFFCCQNDGQNMLFTFFLSKKSSMSYHSICHKGTLPENFNSVSFFNPEKSLTQLSKIAKLRKCDLKKSLHTLGKTRHKIVSIC